MQDSINHLEMHIWMENLGQKSNLRRLQRIMLRHSKRKLENSSFVRSFRWPLCTSTKSTKLIQTIKSPMFFPQTNSHTSSKRENPNHLYKSSPFKYVGIITNQLNIRIGRFLSLHFFVLLEKPSPRRLNPKN